MPVPGSPGEVFRAALRLWLTSFGGPVAHIGYFHEEYVARRRFAAALFGLLRFLPPWAVVAIGAAAGALAF